MKKFKLNTPYITITQLLKAEDFIGSGGEAKFFLCDHNVTLNQIKITERKKKLYPDDIVQIDDVVYKIIYDHQN
jgi:ribosome-associated protein YbcJ (S4-like RNA binding protein)